MPDNWEHLRPHPPWLIKQTEPLFREFKSELIFTADPKQFKLKHRTTSQDPKPSLWFPWNHSLWRLFRKPHEVSLNDPFAARSVEKQPVLNWSELAPARRFTLCLNIEKNGRPFTCYLIWPRERKEERDNNNRAHSFPFCVSRQRRAAAQRVRWRVQRMCREDPGDLGRPAVQVVRLCSLVNVAPPASQTLFVCVCVCGIRGEKAQQRGRSFW